MKPDKKEKVTIASLFIADVVLFVFMMWFLTLGL